MKYQLEQLFMEGEQERIQRENREKKEAEQIAAGMLISVLFPPTHQPLCASPPLNHFSLVYFRFELDGGHS